MKNEDISIIFFNRLSNILNTELIKYDYEFDLLTSEINYDKNHLEN